MASANPICPAEHRRILELARSGARRNEIARTVGRSPSTITKICNAAGITFDATTTARATEAHAHDLRVRRQQLLDRLIEDAERLRQQIFAPAMVHNFGGRDNTYNSETIEEPTFRDKRDLVSSIATIVGRIIDAEKIDHDRTGDLAAIDDFLTAWKTEPAVPPS